MPDKLNEWLIKQKINKNRQGHGVVLIILDSARKHDISDVDMLGIVYDPYVVVEIRPEPKKTLFLGFDNKARPIEVITDTGIDGKNMLYTLIK